MNRFALVATHHKTGSVWMRTVFRAIARNLSVPYVSLSNPRPGAPDQPPFPAIVFSDHSDFSKWPYPLEDERCRIFHLIRDPRDVLISAMHYHRTAKEKWLLKPRDSFQGMSYQEKINSLPDDRSRYLFEMERSAGRVIRDMLNWNYNRPNCFECKYEEIVGDREMRIVTNILRHFGLEGGELETSLRAFWDNSLFGALQGGQSVHIRSGERRQWPSVFDDVLQEEFLSRFPDALVRLGYEKDNSWHGSAPYAVETADDGANALA